MNEHAYKRYLLGVLLLAYAFNTNDRLMFGIALQDIKVDLSLSDTQLGLLTGIAFALFYSVVGLPIARWADRGNRVRIMALATALWSAAMALCAAAGNFWHLLLIRIFVAVGEAGLVPPAHSLIADHFNRPERPRAVAIFNLGGPLSALLGLLLAGWLIELYGWRATFVALGLPGVVLAILIALTLREPRWDSPPAPAIPDRSEQASSSSVRPTLHEVAMTLWRNVTFRHLLLGLSITSFFSSGIAQWNPAFLMRSYGMSSTELGAWLALIYGALGLVGMYLGGNSASKYAARNERGQLKAVSIAYVGFGVFSAAAYLSPNPYLTLALMGLAALGTFAVVGPLFATIQTLIPQRMRAMSIAVLLLFTSLIGTGLGPLAVGVMSDALHAWTGQESLRYALAALTPGYLWCGWHFRRASQTVTRELQAIQVT
jgi:MFS family permease